MVAPAASMRADGRSTRSAILTELVVYAASALISFALLGNLLKKLDPNAQASKQAKVKKKEIAARLGRPLVETNVYEDVRAAASGARRLAPLQLCACCV